jgi:lipopolysaccharide/colanic/teichoic acid biosynthesis glycosyltransferase
MNKRLFDFLGALLLLTFSTPLFLLIALWIKTVSGGPIIFRQSRLGYRGKPFTIFKFRTLKDNTPRMIDNVLPDDQRITVPGKFLRKTHLDELPQFVNVLLGQMSLIGPRPLTLETTEACMRKIPSFQRRLEVLPGITGLQQIHGRTYPMKSKFRLECFYIEHQCVFLNLYILRRTLEAILRCKGI